MDLMYIVFRVLSRLNQRIKVTDVRGILNFAAVFRYELPYLILVSVGLVQACCNKTDVSVKCTFITMCPLVMSPFSCDFL